MRNIFSLIFAVGALCLVRTPVMAQITPIDINATSIGTSKETVNADGIDQAVIRVRVWNINSAAMADQRVMLKTTREGLDEITPVEGMTDGFGKVEFAVRSLKNGETDIWAEVQGQTAPRHVKVNFIGGLDIGLEPGSLVKIPSDSDPNTFSDTAVYYYASNGRRYVFPNEKVYFTWYESFAPVRVISIEDMTKIPIGGNVTYRPGSKPVKFQTDNKVYAVYRNGELKWMKTEQVARDIYGSSWAGLTDDISEAFYINYRFGQPLESSYDFVAGTIANKFSTIEKDKSIGE